MGNSPKLETTQMSISKLNGYTNSSMSIQWNTIKKEWYAIAEIYLKVTMLGKRSKKKKKKVHVVQNKLLL